MRSHGEGPLPVPEMTVEETFLVQGRLGAAGCVGLIDLLNWQAAKKEVQPDEAQGYSVPARSLASFRGSAAWLSPFSIST